jgi:hypothetical protein
MLKGRYAVQFASAAFSAHPPVGLSMPVPTMPSIIIAMEIIMGPEI